MSKKTYVCPPSVAADLSRATNTEVTGLIVGGARKSVISCSCGYVKTVDEYLGNHRDNTCPECGGKLCWLGGSITAPRLPEYARESVCKENGDLLEFQKVNAEINYNAKAGVYSTSVVEESGFSLDRNTLELTGIKGVRKDRIDEADFQKLLECEELNPFAWVALGACGGYPSYKNVNHAFHFIKSCGWTKEQILENVPLYSLLTQCELDSLIHTPMKDPLKMIEGQLGITNKKLRDFIVCDPFSLGGRTSRTVNGKKVDFYSSDSLTRVRIKGLQKLCADRFPQSEFYIDLFIRGVLDIPKFIADAVTPYNDVKGSGQGEVSHEKYTWVKVKVDVPNACAEVFAEFVRKYISRDMKFFEEFYKRTQKLQEVGAPLIIENYLDKEFFRLVNSATYLSQSSDFDEDFKKDPLACLKDMK